MRDDIATVELAVGLRWSAECLADDGQIDAAIFFAEEIESLDFKLRIVWRDEALLYIVSTIAGGPDFDRALEVARTIQNSPHRSRALCRIALGLADAGDLEAARRVASIIDYAPIRDECFGGLTSL